MSEQKETSRIYLFTYRQAWSDYLLSYLPGYSSVKHVVGVTGIREDQKLAKFYLNFEQGRFELPINLSSDMVELLIRKLKEKNLPWSEKMILMGYDLYISGDYLILLRYDTTNYLNYFSSQYIYSDQALQQSLEDYLKFSKGDFSFSD